MFFFHHCFIVLLQFLDLSFTLKVKKKRAKVDSARNPPPPLWTKSIQFFFFFLTSLSHAGRGGDFNPIDYDFFYPW